MDTSSTSSSVILINPPTIIEDTLNTQPIPLGLISISKYLMDNNISVGIMNFSHYTNWDEVSHALKNLNKPIIIGISCYTRQRFSTLKLANVIKQRFPEVIICLGGPHATFLDESILLKENAIDYIIRGEGEETFLDLVNQILSRNILNTLSTIKGISYLNCRKLYCRNADRPLIDNLEKLPLPVQTDEELNSLLLSDSLRFHFPDTKNCWQMAPIITSRGCNSNCNFCCNKAFWGNNRCLSVEYSFKQFEYYYSRGIRFYDIYDDNFTSNTNLVYNLSLKLISSKMKLNWWCSSRVDTVYYDLLRIMKLAGCFMISFGVESGSQLILNNINKDISIESIEYACNLSKQLNLPFRITLSIGHLGENNETINDTIMLINRIQPVQIAIFILKVYPGTPIASYLIKNNLLDDNYWLDINNKIVPFFTYEYTQDKLLQFRNRIINNINATVTEVYEDELSSIELKLCWDNKTI